MTRPNDDDTRRGQHPTPIQTRSMYLDPQGYELSHRPPDGTPLRILADPPRGRWIFQVLDIDPPHGRR